MKKEMARKTLVICMALCMLSAAGCRPDKDSREESTTKATSEQSVDDEVENTTEDSKIESETKAAEDTKKESEAETKTAEDTSATTSAEPVKDLPEDEILEDPAGEAVDEPDQTEEREVQRYIRAALNFYNEQAETTLKLVVFDSQIEETDEGYTFQVRSQDGKDANVLVAEVKVNTTTGEMRDEWDHVWNVEDYD